MQVERTSFDAMIERYDEAVYRLELAHDALRSGDFDQVQAACRRVLELTR